MLSAKLALYKLARTLSRSRRRERFVERGALVYGIASIQSARGSRALPPSTRALTQSSGIVSFPLLFLSLIPYTIIHARSRRVYLISIFAICTVTKCCFFINKIVIYLYTFIDLDKGRNKPSDTLDTYVCLIIFYPGQ